MLLRLSLIFLFVFYSINVFSNIDSKPPQKEQNIEGILLKGGFSGIFDKNTKMSFIGQYKGEEIDRKVYYYEREFGNARLTKRVVIVSGDVYSGMYSVPDDFPVLKEGILIFPNQSDGCCISLKDDEPPQKVLIDGEMLELFK